ncbi:MAG: hypothetical protein JWQ09_4851 [Segetibacter sp.]|nr:hypothetical protein [Segetibacter sp.]
MLRALFLLPVIMLLFERAPTIYVNKPTIVNKHEITSWNNSQHSISIEGLQDPILKADTATCTIPFTRIGKLILLKGKADSTEGNFVLDTGAPYPVLNSTYFRDVEPLYNHDEMQSDINGQGDLSKKTMLKKFQLGTFTYFKVETDLLNLGHIENTRGVKILGLLGVSLFKECELVIDYEKSLIYLHHIDRKERKTYKNEMLNDPAKYTEHDFTLKDNRIIIQTKLAEKKMQFVIDYAAESNIIDSRLPGSVLDSIQITGRILLSGTGFKKVEAITGAMSGFTVGKLEPKELPVIITSLENSCFGNDMCINGVLGYDFLSRYRMVFNFVTRKLYVFK